MNKRVVHWSVDGWQTVHDTATRDTTLGVHIVDLPTTQLRAGDSVDLTFYWSDVNRWEGVDFAICVEEPAGGHLPPSLKRGVRK